MLSNRVRIKLWIDFESNSSYNQVESNQIMPCSNSTHTIQVELKFLNIESRVERSAKCLAQLAALYTNH